MNIPSKLNRVSELVYEFHFIAFCVLCGVVWCGVGGCGREREGKGKGKSRSGEK